MPSVSDSNYVFQQQEKCKKKCDEILNEMPQYVSDFISEKLTGNTFQPRTALSYLYDYKLFFEYLCEYHNEFKGLLPIEINPELLKKVNEHDISKFLAHVRTYKKADKKYMNSEAGIKRKYASISSLYEYMVKHKVLTSNPCKFIDPPRVHEHPITTLEQSEKKEFLEELETCNTLSEKSKTIKENFTKYRDIAICYLFLGTGIRVSELVGINVSDIDFNTNSIVITRKGGNRVTVFFSDEVADELLIYMEYSRPRMLPQENSPDYDALFLSLHRKRISVRQVENVVKTAATNIKNKNISCHKLRSTFGTNLYNATGDIYMTAEALGHKDVNTTRRHYAKNDRMREVPDYVKING